MEPSQPTVAALFESRIVYRIPNYQRVYVWDERNQWEPLWMDITSVATRLLAMAEDDWPSLNPHFLGAVVLKQKSRSAGSANVYTVVDGQQRITTIQLLLAAVADAFREQGLADETLVRHLVINSSLRGADTNTPFKVEPIGRDFQSFREVLQSSKNGVQPSHVTDSMGKCYRFFLNKSSEWLKESTNDMDERANALFTVVSDKLQVVEILLNAGENEYAIFEALNARGEPLSEWEKVKNYILFKAGETRGIDQDGLYSEYLEDFDEPKWRELVGRGANARRKSDLFLDYWLESKEGDPVDARHVFREFRSKADDTDLVAWCVDLKERGIYFLDWEDTHDRNGDVPTIFHSRRNDLQIGAVWPFLIALSRIDMDNSDRNRCLRALDSFIWRRAIAGIDTRGYDDIALSLVRHLPENPSGELPYSNAVIEDLLRTLGQKRYSWPEDDEVRQHIINTPFYEYGTRKHIIRVLLEAVERAMMQGNRPGNISLSNNLPTEHLMPQTRDEKDWPLPSDADEGFEQQREHSIHRLGNLTLVTHGLNSQLSNRSWVEKRKIIDAKDNLFINKDLLTHAPTDHWDEEQIRLRGERLADYILKIWPHGHAVTGEIEKVNTIPAVG